MLFIFFIDAGTIIFFADCFRHYASLFYGHIGLFDAALIEALICLFILRFIYTPCAAFAG